MRYHYTEQGKESVVTNFMKNNKVTKVPVKEKKKYILQQFKYREYAENFSKKIKKAVDS